jgi:hypothetical protein
VKFFQEGSQNNRGREPKCGLVFLIVGSQILNEFSQRFQFLLVDQIEFSDEIVIMFEARIQMCLFTETHDFIEM